MFVVIEYGCDDPWGANELHLVRVHGPFNTSELAYLWASRQSFVYAYDIKGLHPIR